MDNGTAVLALPVVCGVILMSIGLGRIDFSFASFGVMFLFFGAAAFWPAEGKASIDEANTTYQASASTWSAVDQGRQEAQHYQKDNRKTQVPRHNEIVDELARKICKDLDIPFVR